MRGFDAVWQSLKCCGNTGWRLDAVLCRGLRPKSGRGQPQSKKWRLLKEPNEARQRFGVRQVAQRVRAALRQRLRHLAMSLRSILVLCEGCVADPTLRSVPSFTPAKLRFAFSESITRDRREGRRRSKALEPPLHQSLSPRKDRRWNGRHSTQLGEMKNR